MQDAEMGVTHELEDGKSMELQSNGQLPAAKSDLDSEETRHFLEPLTDVHSIVLDFTPVNFIDSVGAKALKSVMKEYSEIGVSVFIGGCSRTVLADLSRMSFFSGAVSRELLFPSVHDAVLHCRHRAPLPGPPAATDGAARTPAEE